MTNNQPAIIFLKTSQLPYWGEATDHAVVLVGMDNQFAYLNDPVFTNAPISVPIGDFDLAWLERDEFFSILTLS